MSSRALLSRLLPLGLLAAASLAVAGSWSGFEAAFPAFPCQDGWSGCIVDGKRLSPEMVLDDKGRPHPSDMRLGFFDFDPLPAFSPFEPLSEYAGEGVQMAADDEQGDAVADAVDTQPELGSEDDEAARRAAEEARRAAEQANAAAAAEEAARKEQAARAAAEEAARRQAEEAERAAREAEARAADAARAAADDAARAEAERAAEAARKAAEEARRKAEEEARAAAEAKARAEEEARRKAEAEAEAARKAAEEEAARKAAEEEAARKAAEAEAARKAEEEARLAAERAAADEAARKAAEAAAAADDAVADASPPPAGDAQPPVEAASCDNLVALEVPAMMGQLGAGVRACLEDRLKSTETQTQRDKISRVLIADAEARRDQADWERLMKRHLENIDRSDPNLCFKYALHLSRGGASRAHGVIRWADYALENKQQWQGGAYTKNVNALLKLRAQAANKLWQAAEKALVENRTDENEAKAERYRGMTKDYAREWLDYARAAGVETSTAMALCVSAAGSKEFCGG